MCDDKCNARGCNSVAQNGNVNASTAISSVNAYYAAVAVAACAAKDRRVWRSFVSWVEIQVRTLLRCTLLCNFHEISAWLDFVSRYNSSFDPASALTLLSQLFSIVLTEPFLTTFNTGAAVRCKAGRTEDSRKIAIATVGYESSRISFALL